MMRSTRREGGFTLVELMLAMAFVSMLLLAIAMTVMSIMGIYTKGLTMKAVNQAGRDVVTDMKRTVGEGQVFTIASLSDRTNGLYGRQSPFVLQDGAGSIVVTGIDNTNNYGGRFCTGNYSYIWNIGRRIDSTHPQVNQYLNDPNKALRLVKVKDGGGTYCANPTLQVAQGNPTELLSDVDLAVQNFDVEQLSSSLSSGQSLYRFTVKLSSANTDALTSLGECRPPSDAVGLENFCSVNDFVFTVKVSSIGG